MYAQIQEKKFKSISTTNIDKYIEFISNYFAVLRPTNIRLYVTK